METKLNRRIGRRNLLKCGLKTTALISAGGISPLALFPGCDVQDASDFDIIIKGGMIYDGILSKPYLADIGIKDDKIKQVGNHINTLME